MNRKETNQLLALFRLAYPMAYRDISEKTRAATLNMWQSTFDTVPYSLMERAFDGYRMEHKYPPTVAEMVEALKKAQAWEVVEKLPQGLDTLLGDAGVRLSGGERQRIVLARVLMNNPRLIVMDEATSALDYESETAIRKAIRELNDQVTVLIIAHRLATVRTAEYAIVLENGTVTENGKLNELVNSPNGYLHKLLLID